MTGPVPGQPDPAAVAGNGGAYHPGLRAASKAGTAVQATADRDAPIGWCHVCVGEAKIAEAEGKGDEDIIIHGALMVVPSPQRVAIGGQVQTVVLPAGVCFDHMAATQSSGLLAM